MALFRKFPVLKEWAFLFTNIHRCYVRVTVLQWVTTFVTMLMIIILLRAQIFVLRALPLKFYWHILAYINIFF